MTDRYNITVRSGKHVLATARNFGIDRGKITFLFGESGIGKSLMCKTLYGIIDPDLLDVTINSRAYRDYRSDTITTKRRRNGFFVFQEPSTHLNPLQRLSEQLSEGSLRDAPFEKEIVERLWDGKKYEKVKRILDLYPRPYRPSGGEKQRVLLAMAFKKLALLDRSGGDESALFVFDEPTGSLDNERRNLFLELLFGFFGRHPFTGIVITHDYSIISQIYRQHNEFADKVSYKELSRKNNDELALDDFAPKDYLSWLNSEVKLKWIVRPDETNVLRVESDFRVFGRKYTIFRDSSKKYPSDLTIRKGEMVYLKAPSGGGKTTLAKIVMGLLPAEHVEFDLCGRMFDHRTPRDVWRKQVWAKSASMVFQHADEALNVQSTVNEIFAGLPLGKGAIPIIDDAMDELFEKEQDAAFRKKKVLYLSGGQKQRLNLIRSLVLDTNLLVLDEPLNGLDFRGIQKVLTFLRRKCSSGTAILLISHNEEIFEHFTDPELVYHLG